jgi:hypothetical protein
MTKTDDAMLDLLLQISAKFAELEYRFAALEAHLLGDDPPRCPRCGSYAWIYKGDRQVCADCGK